MTTHNELFQTECPIEAIESAIESHRDKDLQEWELHLITRRFTKFKDDSEREIAELKADNERLREALKFYDDIDFPYTIAIDALSATPAQTSKGERNAI